MYVSRYNKNLTTYTHTHTHTQSHTHVYMHTHLSWVASVGRVASLPRTAEVSPADTGSEQNGRSWEHAHCSSLQRNKHQADVPQPVLAAVTTCTGSCHSNCTAVVTTWTGSYHSTCVAAVAQPVWQLLLNLYQPLLWIITPNPIETITDRYKLEQLLPPNATSTMLTSLLCPCLHILLHLLTYSVPVCIETNFFLLQVSMSHGIDQSNCTKYCYCTLMRLLHHQVLQCNYVPDCVQITRAYQNLQHAVSWSSPHPWL